MPCLYLILVLSLGCSTWAASLTTTTFATHGITEDKFKETIPYFNNETTVFDLSSSENYTDVTTDSTRAPKSAENESYTSDLDSKDELLLAFHKHMEGFTIKRETTTPAPSRNRNCGKRLIRTGRIVGGQDSNEGEFPWVVSVRLLTLHKCGGTIITDRWILTAAHCVKRYPTRYYRVRIGDKEVDKLRFSTGDFHIEEISFHPKFGHIRRYSHDLALLKLTTRIKFSKIAQPICLPDREMDYTNQKAITVGWGAMKEQGGLAPKLQKVIIPILNNTICAKWYENVYDGFVKVYDYQLCAGLISGGKDACQGDSGGPLLVKEGDSNVMIGAISIGAGCGQKEQPGIYSRISLFVPWIRNITGADM